MYAGLVIALLAACHREPDPATAVRCEEGEVADGEACVPAACGAGPWGDVEVDGDPVYVDASASGGDGSAEAPFPTLGEGAALAGDRGGGLVVVAAGTYAEVLKLRDDGVRLAGRCADLVTIDGSGGGADDPAVFVTGEDVELADLTITGGRYGGVWVERGSVGVRRVELVANAVIGVFALGAEVTVEDAGVRDTEPARDGDLGRGLGAASGARLVVARSTLEGNHDVGAFAESDGTELVLEDVVVRGTLASPDGSGGRGVEAIDGATVEASGCTLDANHEVGVLASDEGTTVRLAATTIVGTEAGARGGYGMGVVAQRGAVLEASSCAVEASAAWGMVATGAGTEVRVADTTVGGTDPEGDAAATAGVFVGDGARFSASESTFSGNRRAGLYATGTGTVLTLGGCEVEGTLPAADGSYGQGIYAGAGASVGLEDCALEGNHDAGLLASGTDEETGAATTVEILASAVRGTLRDWDGQAAVGVHVQHGAALSAEGLEISDTEGPGLGVADAEQVRCLGCALRDNDFAGAVLWGGALALEGAEISGNGPGAADGGGVGVAALSGEEVRPRALTLLDSEVTDHPYAAVWLAAPGAYAVEGCALSGGSGVELGGGRLAVHGNALYARAVTEGLALSRNTLSGAADAALLLDGSIATVAGNTWSDNGVDVVQQRCAGVAALTELDQAPRVEVCTGEDRLVDELDLSLFFEETEAEP